LNLTRFKAFSNKDKRRMG